MAELPLNRHVIFRSSNYDEVRRRIARELPAHRLEFVTGDQRLDTRLHAVRLPHLVAMYLSYGGEVEASHGESGSSVLVQLPISGRIAVRLGAEQFVSSPTRALVSSQPGRVAMDWAPDCAALAFRIDRHALESELADLIEAPVDEPLRFHPVMELDSRPVRSWFAVATTVAGELDLGAGLLDHPSLVAHTERVLLRGLLLCQPHSYSSYLRAETPQKPRPVAAAMRLIEDQPERAFTVASLAREVGAGVRTLQEGFRQHLGLSPTQYLREVRLRRAREDLRAACGRGGAGGATGRGGAGVAEVAYRWGFTHLGRFAQYYRERYGESPSETLRGRT